MKAHRMLERTYPIFALLLAQAPICCDRVEVDDSVPDDGDTGADTDTDTDADTSGGISSAMVQCDGGLLDPDTNLCWQNPPWVNDTNWTNSLSYCEDLDLGGHMDWRLPLVQEMISLMRCCADDECAGDVATSSCGVAEPGCLTSGCAETDQCGECGAAGPGQDGCGWDSQLGGPCTWYWTQSTCADGVAEGWVVDFNYRSVWKNEKSDENAVRCVRDAG